MENEFITNLKELLKQEDLLSISKEVGQLKVNFDDWLLKSEGQQQVATLKAEEEGVELEQIDFSIIKTAFNDLFLKFKASKKQQLDLKNKLELENLKLKNNLIKELKELVENEENIGTAFNGYNSIQDTWKKIGDIPRDKRDNVQKDYSRLRELFFHNITIYKELKENDYKRNTQLKEKIIIEIKEFILADLPDYLSSIVVNLGTGKISDIIKSNKGFHIIYIIDQTSDAVNSFEDLKETIIKDYKKETGTREYFDIIDSMTEMNFTKKYRLTELADKFNIKTIKSKFISKDEGHGIFDYEFVRDGIFTDDVINDSKTSDLIYLNGDRFIIAELDDFMDSNQLSYEDSREIIEALVLNQKTNAAIILHSENVRDDLNAGISDQFDNLSSFVGTIDSSDIDEKIKQLFFAVGPSNGFVTKKLGSKDYIIFGVNEIIYPEDIKNIENAEDYYNFAYNTRSESEFNSFYGLFRSSAEINMNDDYMSRD